MEEKILAEAQAEIGHDDEGGRTPAATATEGEQRV
jgi:hypothetical protein